VTYDASNRKDIRRAEKDARALEVERINYLQAAMSVAQGRAWFYDLLEFCGCFRGECVFETNRDYFAAGMRNVGLRMFADITANCPDDYVTMMREANGRRLSTDTNARRSAGEQPGGEDAGRYTEGSDLDAADYDPFVGDAAE
jgi:hypothetical protein